MAARTPARYAAPVALAAVTIAFFAIMVSNGGDREAASGPAAAASAPARERQPTQRAPRRAYVVRAGDVASVIAERTGVSLQAIETLNPGIDVRAIRPGQKLKLSP
jgi:LysM repeat protein